jgi:hypothetical protein
MLYLAETEINQKKDYGKIKRQIKLDRHGPILSPDIRHLLHLLWLSLQTTLNLKILISIVSMYRGERAELT